MKALLTSGLAAMPQKHTTLPQLTVCARGIACLVPGFVLFPCSVCNATTRCWPQVLAADKTKNTMRVGAGMRYTELLKEAQTAGMSVQVGRQPLLQAKG